MRNNLFFKIFLGFWLITITILGTWLVATHYFDSRPSGENARHLSHDGPPRRFMLQLSYRLSNAADQQLQSIVDQAEKDHGLDIFLINTRGEDILQREVPAQISRLAEKVTGRRSRSFEIVDGRPVAAQQLYRHDQGLLRQITVFPKSRHPVIRALSESFWLRLSLAIAVSGLACLWLSRLLTNRLKELRRASRRLANGELDARILVRDHGGDETDDLARDFNSMAEQLQQRIDSQKRLVSDVSHELRSPIARLRVALALAQDDSEKRTDYLRRIERETARLEDLIDQLLSAQPGQLEMDTHIDLRALLEELCADACFEGKQDAKRTVFDTSLDQAIVASSGDLLHKSFDNIIRNALQHTRADSTVTVALTELAGAYQITVDDEGPGIPEPDLARIFDEFYRVDSSRSRANGGYGLGLAIARRALHRHGGKLVAHNTALGLRITATLPVQL